MYVVERPRLVHAEIREELRSRFVDLWRATTYLSASEGNASKRRTELGVALDRLCVSDRVRKRVIEAAYAGFQALIGWQHAGNPAQQNVG